jgi:chromate reductase
MDQVIRILAFSGSTRDGSYNKKLLKIAVDGARKAGAEVTELDLRDIPMPLYDGDLEINKGIPVNGLKFCDLLLEHDGFLIASPEYNGAFSAVLKNALDWASRPQEGKPSLHCYIGKIASIMSASDGYFGGVRGLNHLRILLLQLGVTVLPSQVMIPKGQKAFGDDGSLLDEKRHAAALKLGADLVEFIRKLKD